MSAYVISDLDIQDASQLQDYVRLVPPTLEAYGGRYVVRRGQLQTLEGQWRSRDLVIVEFPTVALARRWYESPEYQEVKERYFKGATRNLVLVEGV
jgi:uncharacterized protein (DUF1330 family)